MPAVPQGGEAVVKMRKLLGTLIMIIVMLSAAPAHSAEKGKFVFLKALYVDEKGANIKYPEGVACEGKNLLIVADTQNNRLLRYTWQDGNLLGGVEIKPEQLSFPLKVHINSKGEIFVLNGKPVRIVRLSPEGEFKGYVNPEGMPGPSTFVPRSFSLDAEDNIYILDIFSGRVIVLTPDGKFKRAIGFPKEYGFFSDLAVGTTGNVFLIDTLNSQVFSAAKDADTFSPLTKTSKDYVDFPTNITTDDRGLIYVVDQNGSGVAVFGKDGAFLNRQLTFGWNEGLLRYPSQLCINDKGEAFIADRENNRVQIFTISR
jgi:sugar lactone lactonase YvrE